LSCATIVLDVLATGLWVVSNAKGSTAENLAEGSGVFSGGCNFTPARGEKSGADGYGTERNSVLRVCQPVWFGDAVSVGELSRCERRL
jgi:hypothetical protein